jgi:hypothetical protein
MVDEDKHKMVRENITDVICDSMLWCNLCSHAEHHIWMGMTLGSYPAAVEIVGWNTRVGFNVNY